MPSPSLHPENLLDAAGISLPASPKTLGNYMAWSTAGNLVFTSGQLPWRDGQLAYVGKLGLELSIDEGYAAARLATINALAQLKEACGNLNRVARIVRIEGTFQVKPGFHEHPRALDGASDLVNEIFQERGRHSRMIYTNPDMPMNTPVLIVVYAEIR